jgi:hypothetical protein
MINSESLNISGKDINVREMSTKDVDDYIQGRAKMTLVPMVDMLMGSYITSDVILLCTDMTEADLLGSYPSDIDKIIKKIEELNPFFARLAKSAVSQPDVDQ